MKPVLILGAAGQVGQAILHSHDPPDGVPGLGPLVGLTSRDVDIRDRSKVEEAIFLVQPGCVVNLASYTAVDHAEKNSDQAFAVNADGAANVAQACASAGVPLLHLSTDYVFDGLKGTPYVETDHCHPDGVYARSKLAGEEMVRHAGDRHVILRTAWLFGVHGANFVKAIVGLARNLDELSVVDDQVGSPTPTTALAEAVQAIAAHCTQDSCPWGTYHFAGSPPASRYQLALAIVSAARRGLGKDVSVRPIPSVAYPTLAPRPPDSSLDSGKIACAFGLTVPDWRDAVARTVEELLDA